MKMTYDEIYSNLKNVFCSNSGKKLDDMSDIGLRLQAVATELFGLSCYGDYVLKQAFVQTATGNFLEKHAQLRGTSRKAGEKAKTKITFSIPEPLSFQLYIGAGIICACENKPYIQFKTTVDGLIEVGETECIIDAEALEVGADYNVNDGEINVLVTNVMGISSVINKTSATGGFDGETDEMLRKRLINTFKVPQTGLSLSSMESVIESIDGVIECRIFKNDSVLDIYCRTPNDSVSSDLNTKISDALMVADFLGLSKNIHICNPVAVSIKAEIISNPRCNDDVEALVKNIAREVISANGIGHSLELDKIATKCRRIEGVEEINISSPLSQNGIVVLQNNEYAQLENFEVIGHE